MIKSLVLNKRKSENTQVLEVKIVDKIEAPLVVSNLPVSLFSCKTNL